MRTGDGPTPFPSPPPRLETELSASDINPWALHDLLAQIRTEFQRQLQPLDGRDVRS